MDNDFKVNNITSKQLKYNLSDRRYFSSSDLPTNEQKENCNQSGFLKLLKKKMQDNQNTEEKHKKR